MKYSVVLRYPALPNGTTVDPNISDLIVGCIILLLALSAILYLVTWSCRAIGRISKAGSRSAREIVKDVYRGR